MDQQAGRGHSKEEAPQDSNRLPSLKGARILIADDNYVNRRIARSFAEKWEVEIDEAANGREALELFATRKYSLLLIDLQMPVMDGYETIAAIRETNSSIPVYAYSGDNDPALKERLMGKGFTGVLSKPFVPQLLHGIIRSAG